MPRPIFSDVADPADLAQVENLELIATRIVEGILSGRHRSKLKGGSAEFAEHRAYSPGDEVRLLDWRVFAKSDRYYIKQFEEETSLQAVLLLDASGSMDFGLSTATKFAYARAACLCLARLILRQSDAVGLAVTDSVIQSYVPPRSIPRHLQAILERLRQAAPSGKTALAAALREVATRIQRRGLIMIFSDCFEDIEPLGKALQLLRSRGHEAILFHVLAPEELSFSFTRWSRFECLENDGRRVELDPALIRDEYLKRVEVFLKELRRACHRAGCDYVSLATDHPLGEALSVYLAKRAARKK